MLDSRLLPSLNLAIVVDLEPRGPVARQSPAGVLKANHRVSNRPAASVRVNHLKAAQVLTPRFGAARAIAERADLHTRRRLFAIGAHCLFGTRCSGAA